MDWIGGVVVLVYTVVWRAVMLSCMVPFMLHSAVEVLRGGLPGTMYEPILNHIGSAKPEKPPTRAPCNREKHCFNISK